MDSHQTARLPQDPTDKPLSNLAVVVSSSVIFPVTSPNVSPDVRLPFPPEYPFCMFTVPVTNAVVTLSTALGIVDVEFDVPAL